MKYMKVWPNSPELKFDLADFPEIVEAVLFELNFQFESGELFATNLHHVILNPICNDGFNIDGNDVTVISNCCFVLKLLIPFVVFEEEAEHPMKLIAEITPIKFEEIYEPWEEFFRVTFKVKNENNE